MEPFIKGCALYADGQEVAEPSQVTEDTLVAYSSDSYLQFVSDYDRGSVKAEAKRLARKFFGSRLGRVGLFGRVLDALYLVSIFLRPTTPRLTTVSAALKVESASFDDQPVVYGRATHIAHWLVLHYSYFYVMNDWRSSYKGLNDHEGDWEQAWIFCDPQSHQPVWVAASSHEHGGSNLRRHWDDGELMKQGERPLLFASAGSHAMYFRPGDYVTRIDVAPLRWLLRLQRWTRTWLRIKDQEKERGLGPALGVPFVDSATGDGREISEWSLRHLDENRPCFGDFAGLWGLDPGDRAAGERGPSGPKFDRDGSARFSWVDPVGFCGLHGDVPPSLTKDTTRLERIEPSIAQIEAEISESSDLLALTKKAVTEAEVSAESSRLSRLLRQRAQLHDLRRQLLRGQKSTSYDIRGHLHQPVVPLAPPQESGFLLSFWAALSVPLLLLVVGSIFLFDSLEVTVSLLALAAIFSVCEQLVRRHFQAVLRLTGVYVFLAALWFLVAAAFKGVISLRSQRLASFNFGELSLNVIAVSIVVAAVLLFVANLSELEAVQRRAEVANEVDKSSVEL